MDYFATLGVERKFNLDLNQLEQTYFEFQRNYHPDRFASKTSAEKIAALQKSTDINQAYENLKDPFKRAVHLLLLNGVKVFEEEKTLKNDQDFLEEILETREKLEDAATKEQIENFEQMAAKEVKNIYSTLENLFQKQDYPPAAKAMIRLSYMEKMLIEANAKKVNTINDAA